MNILLIAVDTLRADHLSGYGYPRLTSPHIDELAREGTRFTGMIAPHIPTSPSFTTILTGHDIMSHQIVSQGGAVDLDPAVHTLAELLQRSGYFTAAADNLKRWFVRGFDVYESYAWDRDPATPWRKAEAVNRAALDALNRCASQEKPFFLFVHYWDPHTPFLPPPPFDRMFYEGNERDPANDSMGPVFAFEPFTQYFQSWMGGVTDIRFPIAQYDAAIAYADACLAHLLTRYRELGLEGETLVILLADHGETMDEHAGYFDHHGLYDHNLRIPLILTCPGTVPAGRAVDGMVCTMDIAPTVLDFIGHADVVREERMTGQSVLPLLTNGSHDGLYDALFLTECTWMRKRGVRTHRWKLIEAMETDFHGFPPVELYDLHEDPREQTNSAAEYPDVVSNLHARLIDWTERRLAETGKPNPIVEQRVSLTRLGPLTATVPDNQRYDPGVKTGN
ncbi:MAG: sulfatase [Candidatus Latescibacteria bacterium]|nr:sulfatase [Candidatus Latescibacterota bacterium]